MRALVPLLALLVAGCLDKPLEPPRALLERYVGPTKLLDSVPVASDLLRHEPGCERVPILPALDRYDCDIREALDVVGHAAIAPENIKAQIMAESSGRDDAVSPAGAVCAMQLKPSTFYSMLPRGDIEDVEDCIRAGVKYRVWCAKFWHAGKRSEDERFGPLSLGCYNAGPKGMLDAQGECGGYWWAEFGPCAPRETQDYVVRVEGMAEGKPWGFWLL